MSPVPIRYALVRDPLGKLAPQALLCTDLSADPVQNRLLVCSALAVGDNLSGSVGRPHPFHSVGGVRARETE
jgi:hypothetical protein